MDELVLRSTAREKRDTRAKQMARSGGALDRVGVRTLPAPDEVALTIDEASSEEDDEYEGAAAVAPGQRTLDGELELELDDIPFHMQRLHIGSEKPTFQLGAIKFGQRRFAGLIKLQARVIERGDEDDLRNFVQQSPPPNLRKLYAEKQYASGSTCTPPSTSRRARPPTCRSPSSKCSTARTSCSASRRPTSRWATLDPDFYHLLELPARFAWLPQLHVQVDYNAYGADDRRDGDRLEDRLFSKTWIEMQQRGEIPKETRAEAPGSTRDAGRDRPQGRDPRAESGARGPLAELELPQKDLYELRIIIEARGVVAKDMLTKQSDVCDELRGWRATAPTMRTED